MNEPYEIKRYGSAGEVAMAAAEDWAEALRSAQKKIFSTALSGGRIAKLFFAAFVGAVSRRGIPTDSLHLFWADERCVPPEDLESNFSAAKELLWGPLGLSEGQIHRIRGEADPQLAARDAEAEMRAVLHAPSATPVLDLVILGMGEDGHTASLFPGEPMEKINDPAVFRPVIGPKPPPRRVTMGYSTIAASRQVAVLIAEKGKEEALGLSLAGTQTPLGQVLRMRRKSVIYTSLDSP